MADKVNGRFCCVDHGVERGSKLDKAAKEGVRRQVGQQRDEKCDGRTSCVHSRLAPVPKSLAELMERKRTAKASESKEG